MGMGEGCAPGGREGGERNDVRLLLLSDEISEKLLHEYLHDVGAKHRAEMIYVSVY